MHILSFLINIIINIPQFLSAIDHVTMLALSARERERDASNERRNEKEKNEKKESNGGWMREEETEFPPAVPICEAVSATPGATQPPGSRVLMSDEFLPSALHTFTISHD